MNGTACARAASDLTMVVSRLQRAGRALARQSRLPSGDFGGLSGDAYRRHADESAHTVAGLASDVALLAGALAALGRALDDAEGLREAGFGARAHDVERRAQESWREAMARYEGRPYTGQGPDQPVVAGTVLTPDESTRPSGLQTSTTAVTTPPAPAMSAPAPTSTSSPAEPAPTLVSSLVAPQPQLESELVIPPEVPPRCGTTEGLLDDEA